MNWLTTASLWWSNRNWYFQSDLTKRMGWCRAKFGWILCLILFMNLVNSGTGCLSAKEIKVQKICKSIQTNILSHIVLITMLWLMHSSAFIRIIKICQSHRFPWILSCHPSLLNIILGRSSRRHSVSAQSNWI